MLKFTLKVAQILAVFLTALVVLAIIGPIVWFFGGAIILVALVWISWAIIAD